VKSLLKSVPPGALVCAVVALLNATAWSLLTPPFHVPDENAHVGYVQYFAQTGELPEHKPDVLPYSQEERRVLDALNHEGAIGHPNDHPIRTQAQDLALRQVEDAKRDRTGPGTVETASNNPPLYYGVQALPYWASPSARLLDRLVLMRLLSALMAAGTVLAIFLFLREVFPGSSWVWPTGALAAAFQPMFGFIGGGVNSDNLLFLVSACLFLFVARAFNRGLDPRSGALIGAAVAAGLLTKFQFAGLLPAVALGVLVVVWRATGEERRAALKGMLTAAAVASAPIALYALLSAAVWDRGLIPAGPVLGTDVAGGGGEAAAAGGAGDRISFMWQLFLPRVPGLSDYFPGVPLQTVWLNGLIGKFGWLDYRFPDWVYTVGLCVFVAMALAALAALWQSRPALRNRLGELATYAAATAGLCLVIALADYSAHRNDQPPIEQARYLLPLLALYAAIVAAAARLGGRRWGPVIGAILVAVAASHSLFAQLLTLTRYYA
jgi:4-amino-4-deoxy-L-arabinose transferase-like glycosyltransferase